MYPNLGTVRPGSTIFVPFHTFDSNDPSASVTLTGLATTDIEVYKDASMTQRASDSGYALVDTDGIDLDSITGIHGFTIDLSDNTTAGFWAAGSDYVVVVSSVTVDAATVNFIAARFRIGYPEAILNTTIATLASQTSFTLTTGPAEDDALNGMWCVIHDVASAVQVGYAVISDYTGASKTVTLAAGTTFTAAASDNIAIIGPMPLQPTVAGRQFNVAADGDIAGNLDGTVATVTTLTGHTPQTGDVYALANGAAGFVAIDTVVDAIKVKTDYLPSATAGAAGGVFIAGTNAATSITTALTANITGDLSGSVGSVTGAVGSVTGAVGSVTGNVGGNVVGSVASVTGAVGSVTGNVGGNVTGSVGSVAAGGITASSIATGAIDADALATDAVAEIADGVWDEAISGHAGVGSTGEALANATAPTAAAVADAVWDEALSGHLGAGSTGEALNAAGAAGDPWTTTLPGAYTGSQAGKIIADILTDTGTTLETHLTDIKGGTFSGATDSLEALRDRGDAAWTTATGFSTLDASGVRSAVGLASANLDTQLSTIDTVVDAVLVDTGTTLETHLTDMKGATFSGATDSLEALRNRGDAAWITATGFSTLSQADVRTAVGLASANLDTQLSTIDTVVDAILVDTGTDIPNTLSAITTNIDGVQSATVTKNSSFSNFTFPMKLTSDHYTAATGKTVTGQRSLDAGAFASVSGTITEISDGIYQFDALAADTNGDTVTWKFSATDCDDTVVTFKTST